MISVIVPCYNEEKSIELFLKEIKEVEQVMLKEYNQSFEYIFIDDGSKDKTLEIFKRSNIKYISFSRNFGKEAAIYAGLNASNGDYSVIMDVDLQHPPKLLTDMYRSIIDEGYDSVAARRVSRKGEPLIRSYFARIFYKLLKKISETEIIDGATDYRLMNKKFVNAVLDVKEYSRFSKGIFGWVGFKTKWIEYENVERVSGETKWSFGKLLKYSIEGIVAFSNAPLILSSIFGILSCIASFLYIIYIIIKKLVLGDPVAGWASLMSVILFVGGVQLLCIGILGNYLAKVYLEAKQRPIYIVQDTNIEGI